MKINLILASTSDGVIGKSDYNGLLWRIPEDLKFFKETTLGFPVLMGRKTFSSLKEPLRGRLNIVLSRSLLKPEYPDVEYVTSLEQAFAIATPYSNLFIAGGLELYLQTLDLAEYIYLTKIDLPFKGDLVFPIDTLNDESVWRISWSKVLSQNAVVYLYKRQSNQHR